MPKKACLIPAEPPAGSNCMRRRLVKSVRRWVFLLLISGRPSWQPWDGKRVSRYLDRGICRIMKVFSGCLWMVCSLFFSLSSGFGIYCKLSGVLTAGIQDCIWPRMVIRLFMMWLWRLFGRTGLIRIQRSFPWCFLDGPMPQNECSASAIS